MEFYTEEQKMIRDMARNFAQNELAPHTLQARGSKRGIALLCIGCGEATAIAVEVM